MEAVRLFLEKNNLLSYAPAFENEGYDDMEQLTSLQRDDLNVLLDATG